MDMPVNESGIRSLDLAPARLAPGEPEPGGVALAPG
jgi:hypothetical protein